jgi:HNH endonuclease
VKTIELTQGYSTLVDDDWFDYLNQFKWCATNVHNGRPYAARSVRLNGPKKTWVWMHRLIIAAPNSAEVDHANGNSLDNRRANLRICERLENAKNVKIRKDNTSGAKGVAFDPRCPKRPWRVRIYSDRKCHSFGGFATFNEAKSTYNEEVTRLHGQFAHPNK